MAKALRFDRLSLADTEDAIAWYEKQSPSRVSAFCAALDATFDLIEQSPDRFARAFDDLDHQFAKSGGSRSSCCFVKHALS